MYTMRDVARLAGVSIASVSAVVNRKKRVSPDLASRVKRAMEALNYQPVTEWDCFVSKPEHAALHCTSTSIIKSIFQEGTSNPLKSHLVKQTVYI